MTELENTPLWSPSEEDIVNSNITKFISYLSQREINLKDYLELFLWAEENPEIFYDTLWGFSNIISKSKGKQIVRDRHLMPGAKWFPDAELNFAENLMIGNEESDAIIFEGEDFTSKKLTRKELVEQVSILAQAFKQDGVKPGDRIVAYMPNIPETVIAMLAATSLGAIWSSCSPDFGVQGVIDRFGQIKPSILIACESYFYNGKKFDSCPKIEGIVSKLETLKSVVIVPYNEKSKEKKISDRCIWWNKYIQKFTPKKINYKYMNFNDPLYIMYSSGTTGAPKCIVHSVGGTLLQHIKEHIFHTNIKNNDKIFYFTTCGWMMWNWVVSALSCNATIILFDGSPFYPNFGRLWSLIEKYDIDIFGTSAKFIDACSKDGIEPIKKYNLKSLKTILSTGSPLAPDSFDFIYSNVKQNVRLSSISGGTDIISCFASGLPVKSVWRGEIQSVAIGMKVRVFNEEGEEVEGEKGELVCLESFPSMPIGFWDDDDNKRYINAYFKKFPGVWTHGDYSEITKNKGMVIYGRSDTILNPGGVRIGTAEIYRQVESFQEVTEAICVSQEWCQDIRIILFIKMAEGKKLNDKLITQIKNKIKTNASPRHVPAKIISVKDIPRTISGKITELAVRETIHNRAVKNKEALANPEALAYYENLEELRS
ncbi:MAG: acetoacetate--CoA ligase [Rhodospirillaceae bacterium]|nr:acetoacetate--CoA ligase [Rhodospirillaceae bacterium]|tara:strand:- start:288 stop:2249 length:1962 start_codon:yes stop_codon:yes gene_type:complete